MVANCGGRDKVIVIINQNGEDPPIVQQQQQDKHRGHGQSGAEWPHTQPGSGPQEASCSGSDRIRAQVKLNIWTQETINIISIEAATAPHCLDSGAAAEGVLGSLLLSGNSSGHISVQVGGAGRAYVTNICEM